MDFPNPIDEQILFIVVHFLCFKGLQVELSNLFYLFLFLKIVFIIPYSVFLDDMLPCAEF